MSEMTYKVLVACEESQTVCKAFRARGFEAYSCDIQEPSGGHPEWHTLCHSTCSRYLAYRAKMDDISKQRMQAQALNEADVLRGDKIRRDVRNHGLPGHRRR